MNDLKYIILTWVIMYNLVFFYQPFVNVRDISTFSIFLMFKVLMMLMKAMTMTILLNINLIIFNISSEFLTDSCRNISS